MRQVEEKEFMTEWSDTRLKIEDWLGNAESEAYAFDKAHDNIIEVEEQVAEHEVNPIWSPNSKYYLNCEIDKNNEISLLLQEISLPVK